MESTTDAAKRLWNLCNVLRDDGITYHQYISELTLILFFKLASQLEVEADIPQQFRWRSLRELPYDRLLVDFKESIRVLAMSNNDTVRDLFIDNATQIQSGRSLAKIIHGVELIDWVHIKPSSIGDIYESLIDRNAQESRYGAGQYFTPRALVDVMVQVSDPNPQDIVYDPAAGTAGFLVAAGTQSRRRYGRQCSLEGNELVREVQRMGLMNLHLHQIEARLLNYDTLSLPPRRGRCTLCLTNPPFGIKSDVNPAQQESLMYPTSNKQLAFLQHIYMSLTATGRAAVVLPDNVLFETGVAAAIRTHLLDNFNLHTLLRLPAGIFYATGVKTSVLFFSGRNPTIRTWIYDLRARSSNYTKRHPLRVEDLAEFVEDYGADPFGTSPRTASEAFQAFSREDVRKVDDRLDILGSLPAKSQQASARVSLEMIASELEQATFAVKTLQGLIDRANGRA